MPQDPKPIATDALTELARSAELARLTPVVRRRRKFRMPGALVWSVLIHLLIIGLAFAIWGVPKFLVGGSNGAGGKGGAVARAAVDDADRLHVTFDAPVMGQIMQWMQSQGEEALSGARALPVVATLQREYSPRWTSFSESAPVYGHRAAGAFLNPKGPNIERGLIRRPSPTTAPADAETSPARTDLTHHSARVDPPAAGANAALPQAPPAVSQAADAGAGGAMKAGLKLAATTPQADRQTSDGMRSDGMRSDGAARGTASPGHARAVVDPQARNSAHRGDRAAASAAIGGDGGDGRMPGELSNPLPPYPEIAVRQRLEGVVVVHLWVAPDGKVKRARIEHSSGFDCLDDAVMEVAPQWKFIPPAGFSSSNGWDFDKPVDFKLH